MKGSTAVCWLELRYQAAPRELHAQGRRYCIALQLTYELRSDFAQVLSPECTRDGAGIQLGWTGVLSRV